MFRKIITFGLLVLFIPSFAQFYNIWNVKNTGMADCGISVPLDAASVFYNPAFAGAFDSGTFSVGYGMPAVSFGSMNQFYAAYVRPIWWCYGIGVHGNYESISDYAGALRLGIDFTRRLAVAGTLSIGGTVEWLQSSYNLPPDEPLSSRGSANDFSIGCGVLWQPDNRFSAGIAALDLNEPGPTLDTTETARESAKLPAKFPIGISYRISNYFIPEVAIVFQSFSYGEQKNPDYRVGFFGSIESGVLSWRGGYNPQTISLGIGLHTDAIFGGVDVDYSLSIPLSSELRKANATAHYIGLTVYGKPIRRRKGNIRLQRISLSQQAKAKKPVEVIATIKNTGHISLANFTVVFAYNDGSGYRLSYPSHLIDSIAPGDTARLIWRWKPRTAGEYEIRIAADDDGTKIPQLNGSLDETDEKDNLKTITVSVLPTDTISVEPKFTALSATQVVMKVEEEPIVPVVFFPVGSTEPLEEKVNLIDVIAHRLSNNPDALLTLRGYYDSNENSVSGFSGDSLAIMRAKAVMEQIVKIKPDVAGRIKVSREHDFKKPRVISKVAVDDPRIAQENRRVEFDVAVKNEQTAGQFDEKIEQLMLTNPEFQLVITSHRSEKNSGISAIARADSLRRIILKRHPDWSGRIVVEELASADNSEVKINIDADGILYRPVERFPLSESWKNPNPAENVIYIRRSGYDDAEGWQLFIRNKDASFRTTIAHGTGPPPDSIIWDWSIGEESGVKRYLAPGDVYTVYLLLKSAEGRTMEFDSQREIAITRRQRIEAIENIILVEFVFDESEPLSRFLERRLFNFAALFVARADSGYTQQAEIQGHTDNIGTEKRNQKLSSMRAEREYEIMRKFIAYFAGVKNNKLNEWLDSHNCSLSYKGYASERPYRLRGKLLGNNDTPYGRSINRRVTLEYSYQR